MGEASEVEKLKAENKWLKQMLAAKKKRAPGPTWSGENCLCCGSTQTDSAGCLSCGDGTPGLNIGCLTSIASQIFPNRPPQPNRSKSNE